MKRTVLITVLALALTAPAQARRNRSSDDAAPPQPPDVNAQAVAAPSTPPGGLWDPRIAQTLMGMEGNVRIVGDFVTVRVYERNWTNSNASTDTSRASSSNAEIASLFGAEKTLQAAHPNMDGGINMGLSSGAEFSGSGSTGRGTEVEAVITCEVLEIDAAGNLHLWGYKELTINRETTYLVVDGFVRPKDIQMDNTVQSDLLAKSKFEMTGNGVVSDRANGPGWGSRVLDFLWPF